MDINSQKIKEIRKIEVVINSNLFFICAIVTLATMAMMVANFFSRGSFLPTKIGFFYLIVVLVYSLHKEFIRWIGDKKGKRQGEYFVYAWIILTTLLYVIDFFSHDYFDYSREGYALSTLADISYITIDVLCIFVATRVLKTLFAFRK